MFSSILKVFIESLLYAETGVGSKNSMVNETEVVSACMELIVRRRGHDSQLATEINVQLFCDGTRRKTQDAMTGRPVYSGDSEKDSLGTCHAGAALRQTDRTASTRPILVPLSFPFSFLLLPFSSLERRASSLRKQHKVG